jgi:8-oxo-dGTP pyrophosphatase MutT (NUDIX family)
MAQDKLFFVGQKAFIEKEGKILVLFDSKGRVDFPGGKIQEGEVDLGMSLSREVKEETNLAIDIGTPFIAWSFDLPEGHLHAGKAVFLVGYKCSYQKGELNLSDEHSRYEWVGKEDVATLNTSGGHFQALERYFFYIT